MKAVFLSKLGGPGVLKTTSIPDPKPVQNDEVLVHLKAAGVNYAETLARRGLYGWTPRKKDFILGLEGAGTVEEIGPQVSDLTPGDNVIVVNNSGCYAEYIKLPRKQIYPAFSHYSFEENAAFAVSFFTAYIALQEMARVRYGETLLVQAAAGGLGTATVLLGKVMGLKTAGTASQDQKLTFLVDKLGIDLAINYKTENFVKGVKEWTKGEGIDIILESVGGKVFHDSLACLAPMGRLVIVGASGIRFNKLNPLTWYPAWRALPRVNVLEMLGRSQGVLAFHAGRLLDSSYDRLEASFNNLVKIVRKNSIKPIIDEVYPLERAGDAHRRLESRQNIGKIVLKIN
ncbi:MAG: zinc-binding alcohol dehydrogenase family protein [Candidatus Odinarchaeota archaeon]